MNKDYCGGGRVGSQVSRAAAAVLALVAAVAPVAGEVAGGVNPDVRVLPEIRKHYAEAKAPPRLIPLAPGAVRPEGWLRDWAETSAEGFAGELDHRHIAFEKGWTGEEFKSKGSAGKGLRWPLEQSAYWLDSLVRLAHILDDEKLKAMAHERLDKVVEGVNKGGETFVWWEPAGVVKVEGGDERFDQFTRLFNNWSHAHMGRALVAYYRATGKPEILQALTKVYATYPLHELAKDQFFPHGGATNLDAMLETYALSGDQRVLENAVRFAESPAFKELAHAWATGDLPDGHTVLYYEHARVPAVTYPWTGNAEALQASRHVLEQGLERHGLPVGLASGQEYMMGRGSTRGLETCTPAASGWTNKWMLQVTGERQYADTMERAIFNAGAAAVSRDFDTVCYFQSMNRIDGVVPAHEIKDVAGFDYHPTGGNTICCVANATRMIPDYVQHMWMATPDGGLAATLYGPNKVDGVVGEGGKAVTIESKTSYPFREDVEMTVTPVEPTAFPLYVRVPGWCDGAEVKVNGEAVAAKPDEHGFVKVDRTWAKGDKVSLRFPMKVKVEVGAETPVPKIEYFKRPMRAVPITKVTKFGQPYASVQYGPLLFALGLPDETPNKAKEGAKWQYALDVDPRQAAKQVEVVRGEIPEEFGWQLDAPVKLRVPAVRFDWRPSNTQPLPDGPVEGGEQETVTLVPYGATKFRVAMFPVTGKVVGGAKGEAPTGSAAGR